MAAADFDLYQITDTDPYLETTTQADEPPSSAAQAERVHTTAVMDTDKSL